MDPNTNMEKGAIDTDQLHIIKKKPKHYPVRDRWRSFLRKDVNVRIPWNYWLKKRLQFFLYIIQHCVYFWMTQIARSLKLFYLDDIIINWFQIVMNQFKVPKCPGYINDSGFSSTSSSQEEFRSSPPTSFTGNIQDISWVSVHLILFGQCIALVLRTLKLQRKFGRAPFKELWPIILLLVSHLSTYTFW